MKRSCLMVAVLVAAALLALSRCGTVTAVTPLYRGESALAVSVGGPVTNVADLKIPLPYAVARYRYGLSDQAGLYAGGHLLTAGFSVVGIDLGFSYHFLKQSGWVPCVGASAGLAVFIEPGGEEAMFPQLDATASYRLGDRFTTYFGAQSMYQFSRTPYVVFAPLVGGRFRLGRSLSVGLEAKWYAPTEPTEPRNVHYPLGVANHGAIGFVLGADWQFGGNHE